MSGWRVRAAAVLALVLFASPLFAEEIVAPATRNVTPSDMTPGPTGEGPLIREAVPPRPPDPPRWRRYFLPETSDAATFTVKNLLIHIAGVTPPAVDEKCRFADGSNWPCGETALYWLRRFLHGRAVECYFPPPGSVTEVSAPCRVGTTDLGQWLLSQGWVRPGADATDAYRTAGLDARCGRLGLWQGESPPADCPAKN